MLEPPPRGGASGSLRVARAILLAALACEGFYLVAMNVFLATPLFEKAIDGTPLIVDVHYARGWSLFPARIHARGLSIRGTDSHVEWILRFDEVDFDCSLLALARRQFHVTRARGSGITFRARLKVAAPAATSAHVENLPAIDSLGPVGFIPSEPASPAEWNDKEWHLWTVQIDDAVAEHVREIWIEGGRFEGDARVAGGFLLKPMRAAYVGPAHVDVRRGSVGWDGRTVAEPLVASLDFELSRFDPRYSTGADILPRISLSVDAKSRIPDLQNLGASFPGAGHVEGELDVPRIGLRVVKGVLRDGTHVEARGAKLRVTTGTHAVSGEMSVAVDVAKERLAVLASLEGIEADSAVSIARMTVSLDSTALALDAPFADLHGVLDVPAAEVDDARRLTDGLAGAGPVRISRGRLRASLHAEGWRAEDRVSGSMTVRGRDLDVVALDGDRAKASFDLRAPGATFSADVAAELTHHVVRGAASVEIRGVGLASAKLRLGGDVRVVLDVARWDLAERTLGGNLVFTARGVTGAFHPEGSAPDFIADRIDGRASVGALDLRRPSMRGVDYAFRLNRAELADARALNTFLPSPTIVAIESGHALVSADIGTSGPAHSAVGRIDVALDDGAIRFHETHLAGDFALSVRAHGFDPARAVVDLEGSRLAMRNVSVRGAFTETSAWRGDLVLQTGTLGLATTPRLEGDLTLQARDASPILGVLFRDTLPRFVAELTRMPGLTAFTHVVVEPENLVVSDLSASGGDLAVRGTYVIREKVRRAAFVVQKGPWSVGIDLDDDGSHVRLFGLDRWYGEQSRQALVR